MSARRLPLRSLGDRAVFFWEFLKHPAQVASLFPSSRFLERRIAQIAELESARAVIELGAGTGGVTRAVLNCMAAGRDLLSVEINPEFQPALLRIGDPRLRVHTGSADDLESMIDLYGLHAPDVIVSGIPFSKMSPHSAVSLLHTISRALIPGGRFVAYQLRGDVERLCRPILGPPTVEIELLNIPPLRIFRWQKPVRRT
jgi:phospholipid N-methyltransferase